MTRDPLFGEYNDTASLGTGRRTIDGYFTQEGRLHKLDDGDRDSNGNEITSTNIYVAYGRCGDGPYIFDSPSASTFNVREGETVKLATDGTYFTLTDSQGNRTRYLGFGGGAASPGAFESYTDWRGNKLLEVVNNSFAGGGAGRTRHYLRDGEYEDYVFTYSSGSLQNVKVERDSAEVSKVAYSYADLSLGSAVTEATLSTNGTATGKYLYRLQETAANGGFVGSVKYVFGPEAYQRAQTAFAGQDLKTYNITALAPYADAYYEYTKSVDGDNKYAPIVKKVVPAGEGEETRWMASSPFEAGLNSWARKTVTTLPDGNIQITFVNYRGQVMLDNLMRPASTTVTLTSISRYDSTTAEVTASGHGYSVGDRVLITGAEPEVYNGLFTITQATSTTFRYTVAADPVENASGGSLKAVKAEQVWSTFYKFDSNGNQVMKAYPSAVETFDESKADLLNLVSSNYQHLRNNQGKIEVTDYYASTTAAGTGSGQDGGVQGYIWREKVQRGESGTAIVVSERTYYEREDSGAALITYPLASYTEYAETNGTEPRTTQYEYGFHSTTNRIVWRKTIAPPVIASHNGRSKDTADKDRADTTIDFYDQWGRVSYRKDADSFITYNEYDPITGAIVRSIRDLNTARDANADGDDWDLGEGGPTFTGRPTDPTTSQLLVTPTGGGLHLVTTREVDSQGRVIKETDPNGNVTHTVYEETLTLRETRVYRGWDSTAHTTTGLIEVTREHRDLGFTESFTMAVAPTFTSNEPDGDETIGSLRSLTRSYVDQRGQTTHMDRYFLVSSLTYGTGAMGSIDTNYHRTVYGYDSIGRQNRELRPTGTIYRSLYDARGNLASSWIGTNDTGATEFDPDGSGGGNNMIKVSENTFDGGSTLSGDGNLTSTTLYPGGGASSRVSNMYYDWRGRLIASLPSSGPLTYLKLNNLGEVGESFLYYPTAPARIQEEDGGDTDGVPNEPSSSLRRAKTVNEYDNQGRVFRTTTYSVNASTGNPSSTGLKSETWYDARGNVIKVTQPGSVTIKYTYDGAGRNTKTFQTDGSDTRTLTSLTYQVDDGDFIATATLSGHGYSVGDVVIIAGASPAAYNGTFEITSVNVGVGTFTFELASDPGSNATGTISVTGWRDATTRVSDTVLSQQEMTYDNNGNLTFVVDRQRFHNATGTGDLQNKDTNPKARVSYQAMYYDKADRIVAEVNVGTYGGDVYTRPGSVPARDSNTLVTSYEYSDADNAVTKTSPRNIAAKTFYDGAGRVSKVIEDFSGDGIPDGSNNRNTDYVYDGNDNVVLMRVVYENCNYELTRYSYDATTGTGSAFNSKDVLTKVEYPHLTSFSTSSTSNFQSAAETFTYNGLGEMLTKTDRSGNVHTYTYDDAGRLTRDAVTTVGSGVDSAMRRIDFSYDELGRPYETITYDATTEGTALVLRQPCPVGWSM